MNYIRHISGQYKLDKIVDNINRSCCSRLSNEAMLVILLLLTLRRN